VLETAQSKTTFWKDNTLAHHLAEVEIVPLFSRKETPEGITYHW
jgi:hypothetical protein